MEALSHRGAVELVPIPSIACEEAETVRHDGAGDGSVQAVVTGARVVEVLADQLVKAELAIEEQTAIRADLAAVERDPDAAIKTQPSVFGLAIPAR